MRSAGEIRQEIATLEAELAQVLEVEKHAARAEIARIMQRAGLSVEDVFGGKTRGKSGMPLPIKYRKGDKTWSGYGRMPQWLKDAPNPEQFRVHG
jgi:DNA-binding protein H-NS